MAHGGIVLALFDAVLGGAGPRRVTGRYLRRVPLGAPLHLSVARDTTGVRCRVLDPGGTTLVDGAVTTLAAAGASAPLTRPSEATAARRTADVAEGRGREGAGASVPPMPQRGATGAGMSADVAGPGHGEGAGASVVSSDRPLPVPRPGDARAERYPLPVSASCFVCGTDNPLGLRARLGFDGATVHGTWRPRAAFARPDGGVATAALTSLLDEAAFWLGVLATGESGMTTELDVTLRSRAEVGRPIVVVGERARVTSTADDARYWSTAISAMDETRRTVATARITFVAVRGAARRLTTGLSATNPPDVIRRVFPWYAG
jgi:hypothetical protein